MLPVVLSEVISRVIQTGIYTVPGHPDLPEGGNSIPSPAAVPSSLRTQLQKVLPAQEDWGMCR